MSTFFEKLTGARSVPPTREEETLEDRTMETPRKRMREASRPLSGGETRRLKVESEERPRLPAEEMPPEEEGELTLDIYDKGDAIIIQSTVAGVKPEDLDVSITNDSVTIRGRREQPEKVEDKDYYYKELFWGTFSRSVILPEEIEEEDAEAILKHGLLTIRLPKKRRGVVQKLKVKVS